MIDKQQDIRVSVILPAPPGEDAGIAREGLRHIDYDPKSIEIILVNGRQPSRQRNFAAKETRGEVIYFLDSDSVATRNLFATNIGHIKDADIAGAGGPELSPKSDTFMQRGFGHILGSFLGCFNTRSRFAAFGEPRDGTERSFILCNFAIRREVFIEAGGFNESLYPNEENELINRLRLQGHRFIYDPSAYVHKSRRPTLRLFMKQIFNYGRGRMEHVLIGPILANLIYFIPIGFVVYLATLPFIDAWFWRLPLYAYFALALASSLSAVVGERDLRYIFVLPWLYLVEHMTYAAGMIWGLIKKIFRLTKPDDLDVRITRVKEFDKPF